MLKLLSFITLIFFLRWEATILISFIIIFFLFFFFYSRFTERFAVNNIFLIDNVRCTLLILLGLVFVIILIRSYFILLRDNISNYFKCCVSILYFILFLTFLVFNLFQFYLFFEISLIPTFFLIMMWGYQPERIQATLYILIYTVAASLPLMVGIFVLYRNAITLYIHTLLVDLSLSHYWYVIMLLAFIVKLPLYIFHLWLPKAHVEAPVAGSVILAAVLLKLGGYGIIRLRYIFSHFTKFVSSIFISISMWGIIITSIICIRQSDIKCLIAYSSVGHIGIVVRGIIRLNSYGYWGSYIIIISHGLVSSGLFCIANIIYEFFSTRRIIIMKGIILVNPIMSILWFITLMMNVGVPPFISLIREIIIIMRILNLSIFLLLVFLVRSLLRICYSLYLYISLNHGVINIIVNYFIFYNSRNYLTLVFLIRPMFIFFLYPNIIIFLLLYILKKNVELQVQRYLYD